MPREPGRIHPKIREAIRDAAAGRTRWPLVILGKPGSGKTCAGLCVADHVEGSAWWSWDEFWRFVGDVNFGEATKTLGGQWNPEGWFELTRTITYTPQTWWSSFNKLSLVVIDDIGLRANANDTQYESLKMALDKRDNLPLIVTSNLTLPGLGTIFDLRVMDRLGCGTVIELFGKDIESMR